MPRAGFRSTLFTVVEQFYSGAPTNYLRLVGEFQRDVICHDACVANLLAAMVDSSVAAAWYRRRTERLTAYLREAEFRRSLTTVLDEFETGAASSHWAHQVERLLFARKESPRHELLQSLSPEARAALEFQLARLFE